MFEDLRNENKSKTIVFETRIYVIKLKTLKTEFYVKYLKSKYFR